jgi:hypothetical protein
MNMARILPVAAYPVCGPAAEVSAADGKAAVCLGGDGIVHLRYCAGSALEETHAQGIMSAVNAACGDRRRPLLLEMSGLAWISRGARAVFAVRSRVSKIALLGASQVERVFATSFIRLHTMPCPTAFFSCRATALQWLRA